MTRTQYLRTTVSLVLALVLLGFVPRAEQVEAGQLQAGTEKVAPGLKKEMASDPSRKLPIIVQMKQPKGPSADRSNGRRSKEALDLLGSLGPDGKRVGGLQLIGAATGFANARGINALSLNPQVDSIYIDSIVRPRVADGNAPSPGQAGAPYPFEVGANKAWLGGTTGRGVGVAVLDSGIGPHEDLTLPTNRIIAAANFAGDLGGMPDAGGHGTHVAGIIAGNSTHLDLAGRQVPFLSSTDTSQADYVGIAPGANIIDVRVLDSQGNGRISSVIAGIQWVLNNKAQYSIRVINLSVGAPTSTSYRNDPLSAAVEMAWKRGIVVVTAAGNEGPDKGSVETPGIDPYAITVGALDDQGTITNKDDLLAPFSSWGTPPDSTAKPDLVSPGRRIVSLRVPGSYLDQQLPDRAIAGQTGPNYFRLTGTSMSTAVVSGVVALMLERRPELTPDQVKAILLGTAQPFGKTSSTRLSDPTADGAGLINADAAVTGSTLGVANRSLRPADPLALALYPVLYGQPLTWKDPSYAGINWDSLTWDNLAWDNLAWDNLAWDNLAWDNLAWDNLAWDNLAWDNLAWDNQTWDSQTWDSQPLN